MSQNQKVMYNGLRAKGMSIKQAARFAKLFKGVVGWMVVE